jgi:AraC-like DNA-binding protein
MDLPDPSAAFIRLNRVPLSVTLGSYACDVLNWGYIGPEYWRNYLHTHSSFEVCYAFAGRGTFSIAHLDRPVGRGDVFVARPGEPHEIVSSVDDPLGICFWAYTLVSTRFPHSDDVDALLDGYARPGVWVRADSTDVAMDVYLLEREAQHSDAASQRTIDALTTKLFLDTARLFVTAPVPARASIPPRLTPAERTAERIARYLRDNQGRQLSVRDVAAEVNLSERHANRLFHEQMGVSIVEYLTQRRIESAVRLLLERRLSIKEVAHAVGYSDVHYFTTLFRRRTGMPPAAFRARSGTHEFANDRS